VDDIDGTGPDGTGSLVSYPTVSHQRSGAPVLRVSRSSGEVVLRSLGAQLTRHRAGTQTKEVPVLAYTVDPVMLFRQSGGESVAAHVAALLSLGFLLSATDHLGVLLQEARAVHRSATCLVTPQGQLSVDLGGEGVYSFPPTLPMPPGS
jgi:hypothetical protein